MRIACVISDQTENPTAVKGISEKAMVKPIAEAMLVKLNSLGHATKFYDPNKTYDITPALHWSPEVVIFLHCDSNGTTRPQGVMGVEDSRNRNTDWATDVVNRVGAIGWGVWGISTDMALRNFRYWFFRQCDGYHVKSLVLELINMTNPDQAYYLYTYPSKVGNLIAEAIHESLGGEAPMAIDTVAETTWKPELDKLVAAKIITKPEAHEAADAASVGLLWTVVGRLLDKIAVAPPVVTPPKP